MKEITGFDYECSVDTILKYMQLEIDNAIKEKKEFVTDFSIYYETKKYRISVSNNYSKNGETQLIILLNKQYYKSMEEFITNANFDGVLIKNIKQNLLIELTYFDSDYLNEIEENNSKQKIITRKEFKCYKSATNMLLFCAIFLTIFTIAARWLFNGQPGAIIGYIGFDAFAILAIFSYIYLKKRKIVYDTKVITIYGLISKRVYNISDIASATELPTKGTTIKFNDGKKVLISCTLMNNYKFIKRILNQNNIQVINYFDFV